jgi:hypothetical protein
MCLTLIDTEILFKVKNFRDKNVFSIKENWANIEWSLKKAVDLLVEFGFCKETMTTQNIIIPIVYYIYKGGKIDTESKQNMRKYLIYGMLKQIFGKSGETVLSTIRQALRKDISTDPHKKEYVLKEGFFDFDTLSKLRYPGDVNLFFTEKDIDSLFEYKKGAYTFMLLSLLYPNFKFSSVKFHQDHMHPYSKFTAKIKTEFGLDDEQMKDWRYEKECLANLSLLTEKENWAKNDIPLSKWFDENVGDKDSYKSTHYIPDTSLEFSNFEEFIKQRKACMKSQLKKILIVPEE